MKIVFADYDQLYTNYRAFKTAQSFLKNGFDVEIYSVTDNSMPKLTNWDNIKVKLFKIYPNLSLKINLLIFITKLFLKLLVSKKPDIYYSHDIFPLFPMMLLSFLKRVPYIYDAHEFWQSNPHTEHRKFAKKFWSLYERISIKNASKVITVSDSIAHKLKDIYHLNSVEVITNLPIKREINKDEIENFKYYFHEKFGVSKDKKIILYQGGLLYNNGIGNVIKALSFISNNAVFVLLGDGDDKEKLKKITNKLNLTDRIFFHPSVPQHQLYKYTYSAYIGISVIKNIGLSYYYSMPNKMFEYMQAGIPQITSNFPEMSRIINETTTGILINPENIAEIAENVNKLLSDTKYYEQLKKNCEKYRDNYYWDSIENKLINLTLNIVKKKHENN